MQVLKGNALEIAMALVEGLEIYFWIGLGVSALFLTVGVDRVVEAARGSYIFRVLLIPGVIVLWPLVLIRWAMLEIGREPSTRQRIHRSTHACVWILLAVLLPTALAGAMVLRVQGPMEAPAVLLEAPGAEGTQP